MMATAVLSKKCQTALKQSLRSQVTRSMTIISEDSKEEYKKLVSSE